MVTWSEISRRLRDAGIEEPCREARFLVRAVTGFDPAIQDFEMNDALEEAVLKRIMRIPLSKIIGAREFYGRDFVVNEHVLDPRPDSETLIEAALKILPPNARILDMGTGSGCLLLTLLAERQDCTGVGVDISPEALAVAKINAARLDLLDRVQLVENGFATYKSDAPFDVLISNPPYIPSEDIHDLTPEVRDHDPRLALDGGPDGCAPYRVLFGRMRELLSPGSHFLVEIGFDICDKVTELAVQASHTGIDTIRDLAGHRRVVTGRCG